MRMERLTQVGRRLLDRREFLGVGAGLSGIALSAMLASQKLLAAPASAPIRPEIDAANPHAPRKAHHRARAKNVLVIFASGACSHLDTWDYKPELIKRDGQPLPGVDKLVTFQGENGNLAKSPYAFRPRGKSGKMISDLVPHLGELVDEMCFVHGMTSKTNTHGPAENFMSTGFTLDGFPSMGAWVSYALGTENQSLPAYVAIPDPRGVPQAAGNNWGAGFLPAMFQGTPFNTQRPIRALRPPEVVSADADRDTRAFLQRMNESHLRGFSGDTELAARIASYELAARMQVSVPEVTNIDGESAATLAMYGADDESDPVKAGYARNCILARRLIERGVRFVQLFNGAYAMGEGVGNWDGHKKLADQYPRHARIMDQPTAALLRDMKARGLLEETVVLWCTEFGRMPTFQKGASGRDHNPHGFTCWLAGAGVKAGTSYGATDEFGHKAEQNVASVYDLHATVLHLLGLEHERLTFYHNGIERRLTDVHGRVMSEVLV
jgi:hypothetical protein